MLTRFQGFTLPHPFVLIPAYVQCMFFFFHELGREGLRRRHWYVIVDCGLVQLFLTFS